MPTDKRATFEDAAKKAGLKHRINRDFRCCWPKCRDEQTGVIIGWGLCDKHDVAVWKIQDKMNEKLDKLIQAAQPRQPDPAPVKQPDAIARPSIKTDTIKEPIIKAAAGQGDFFLKL